MCKTASNTLHPNTRGENLPWRLFDGGHLKVVSPFVTVIALLPEAELVEGGRHGMLMQAWFYCNMETVKYPPRESGYRMHRSTCHN